MQDMQEVQFLVPEEILFKIFYHLLKEDPTINLSFSKSWHRVFHDNRLWRNIYEENFGGVINASENFYSRNKYLTTHSEYKRLLSNNEKLGCAIYYGYTKILTKLLSEDKKLDCYFYWRVFPFFQKFKIHAIHLAAYLNHPKIIEIFLDDNPNLINEQDGNGFTPLHYACHKGHVAVVKLLLEKRAQLDIQTIQGYSWSAQLTKSHQVKFGESTARMTVFHIVAEQGHEECLDILLENLEEKKSSEILPANLIDAIDVRGNTGLHNACARGHLGVVKTLIAHDADVKITNFLGQSLVHIACENNQVEIVEYLVENHKELLMLLDNKQSSALHYASKAANPKLVELLVNQNLPVITLNPDYFDADPYQRIPLFAKERTKIIKLFEKKSPDIKTLRIIDFAIYGIVGLGVCLTYLGMGLILAFNKTHDENSNIWLACFVIGLILSLGGTSGVLLRRNMQARFLNRLTTVGTGINQDDSSELTDTNETDIENPAETEPKESNEKSPLIVLSTFKQYTSSGLQQTRELDDARRLEEEEEEITLTRRPRG